MHKTLVFLVVMLAVAVLGLGFYFILQIPEETSVAVENTPQVSLATSTIAESTNSYSIKVDYPVFSVSAMDSAIRSAIDAALVEFKAVPSSDEPGFPKYEFLGQYQDAYIGPDLLSVRLDLYQYTGGAHGMTIASGINFKRDGTRITLDDALVFIGKTLSQVSDAATKQLTEEFEMVQFPEGVTPIPENYSTFTIAADSVTFVFQQYQVEAYSAGMPEISFPRVK